MKSTLRRVVAAAIPLAVLASSTHATDAQSFGRIYHPFSVRPYATGATTLGGGATLPVPAYLGKSVSGAYESSGTTSFGVAGSIFGYFASVSSGLNVEYCATGSGKGKGIFSGPAKTVDNPCANAKSGSTSTVFGFLPPSGTPIQTYPTIAGTDAPLTQADYDNAPATGATAGYIPNHPSPYEPVELPSVFGAIALYYNHSGVTTRLNFTTAQVCGIYDGAITTWGGLTGKTDTTPIVPIYRADGSGTTFNFSNHLATVCGSGNYNGSQTSTGTTAPIAFPKLPKTAIGETGNGGILAEVKATNNTIGYVEAGYLTPSAATVSSALNYADVLSKDPFANLPESANAVSSSLDTNDAVVQGTGPATVAALKDVRSGSCVKIIPPSAYANITTGYSILAVTYLLFNSAGNGTSGAADLKNLEAILNTPADFKHPGASAPITTVDEAEPATKTGAGTTGYSSLGTAYNTTLKTTANACIGA